MEQILLSQPFHVGIDFCKMFTSNLFHPIDELPVLFKRLIDQRSQFGKLNAEARIVNLIPAADALWVCAQ